MFERNSKHVNLTPAGVAFGARARRMLDWTLKMTRRASTDAAVELRVGFAPSMIFRRLPDFLHSFEERHPTARNRSLREMNSRNAVRRTSVRGQIDVGFIHGLPLPDGVASILLMDEPLVLGVPAQHRLAQASFVSLQGFDAGEVRHLLAAACLATTISMINLLRAAGTVGDDRPRGQSLVDRTRHGRDRHGRGAHAAVDGAFQMADVAYLPLDRDYGRHERAVRVAGRRRGSGARLDGRRRSRRVAEVTAVAPALPPPWLRFRASRPPRPAPRPVRATWPDRPRR